MVSKKRGESGMTFDKKKTGGLILAAGSGANIAFEPLIKIGNISVLARIYKTFKQAQIDPIVVVTGDLVEEVESELPPGFVIFLHNDNYANSEMLDSVKIGLNYLNDKCEQVLVTPGDIPMFTKETIEQLIHSQAAIVSPSYQGKPGHPILINSRYIPKILSYAGEGGLGGAILSLKEKQTWINVADEGILYDGDDMDALSRLLSDHNQQIDHVDITIRLSKEKIYFDVRTKMLLLLISETDSVKKACEKMGISNSTAWGMINKVEEALGHPIVQRRHGGRFGGKSSITDEGIEFLQKYEWLVESVRKFANDEYDRIYHPNLIKRD
jgi:molybdate transport repressor ModE-like protein